MTTETIQKQLNLNVWNVFSFRASSQLDTFNLNVPTGYRGIFYSLDSGPTLCGMWFLWSTSGGTVAIKEIAPASGISFNTQTNNILQITKTASTSPYFVFFETDKRISL